MGYIIPDEKIQEKAKELNVKVLDKYSKNNHTYLRIKCLTHLDKPEREVELYNFLNRDKTCGCMLRSYTIEDLKNSPNIRGDLEIIGEYINNSTHILCQCKICGHKWYITPNKLTQGRGCPNCYSNKLSAGERYIEKILKNEKVKFERQKEFDGCFNPLTNRKLKFDFYLLDYKMCIEYQGQQHYKPINFRKTKQDNPEKVKQIAEENLKNNQYRDNIKRVFCLRNNIILLEIPYWEQKNIKEIILNKLNELNKK